MNNSLRIFLIIALFIGIYFSIQGYSISQNRTNRIQCQEWKEQLKTNEYFYLTERQENMCKELGELWQAYVKLWGM